MNANRQTTVIKGNNKESKMKITAPSLIRWAGLSAMVAGIIFAVIQPIHPPDVLSSVTTSAWAIINSLKTAMCLFGLLGIAGLYARQVEETGWLGLAGYLLLSLFYAVKMGFTFVEAFILPLLATVAPTFVESFLGIASGAAGQMNLGALATVYSLVAVLYLLGGLLFGIAMFRAGILPRWAAGLLASRGRLAIVGCAASAPARAVSGGADGVRSGLAGLCALVGTARASLGTRTRKGKPPAPPNRSRVRSLETAWSGQAAIGRLSHCALDRHIIFGTRVKRTQHASIRPRS